MKRARSSRPSLACAWGMIRFFKHATAMGTVLAVHNHCSGIIPRPRGFISTKAWPLSGTAAALGEDRTAMDNLSGTAKPRPSSFSGCRPCSISWRPTAATRRPSNICRKLINYSLFNLLYSILSMALVTLLVNFNTVQDDTRKESEAMVSMGRLLNGLPDAEGLKKAFQCLRCVSTDIMARAGRKDVIPGVRGLHALEAGLCHPDQQERGDNPPAGARGFDRHNQSPVDPADEGLQPICIP